MEHKTLHNLDKIQRRVSHLILVTPSGKIRNQLTEINIKLMEIIDGNKDIKQLQDEFQVRDALRGDVTGEYWKDLNVLLDQGDFCTESLYNEAYQNTIQP